MRLRERMMKKLNGVREVKVGSEMKTPESICREIREYVELELLKPLDSRRPDFDVYLDELFRKYADRDEVCFVDLCKFLMRSMDSHQHALNYRENMDSLGDNWW